MANLQVGSKIQILEQVIKFIVKVDESIEIEPHEIVSLNMDPICQLFHLMLQRIDSLRKGLFYWKMNIFLLSRETQSPVGTSTIL